MATPTSQARPTRPRVEECVPASHVLSNGRFVACVTEAGSGFSTHGDLALTRWAGDRIEDRDGWWIWLRDRETGRVWMPTLDPGSGAAAAHAVRRTPGALGFERLERGIESSLVIAVDPDHDVEIRRLTLVNRGEHTRRIEVTGSFEVVLHDAVADAAHTAFSKLFVQTAWSEANHAVLARRRPRANDEHTPWLAATLSGEGELEHETDRARFLGRGGRHGIPRALMRAQPLSGTVGNVLDPVMALRRTVQLAPGASATLVFAMSVGDEREDVLRVVQRASQPGPAAALIERADASASGRMRALGLGPAAAEHAEWLLGAMLYGHPRLRARADVLARAAAPGDVLHRLGIPGGPRFVVVCADAPDLVRHLPSFATMLRYWEAIGWPCTVVALGEGAPVLAPSVHRVASGDLAPGERDALLAHARFVLDERTLPLLRGRVEDAPHSGNAPAARGGCARASASRVEPDPERLVAFNGLGGFSTDGREYVIRLEHSARHGHRLPPVPWVNVIANEDFGTLVSETGASTTWSRNSREYRLTPWFNDAVLDPHGEALYLRDDETGEFWSPLAGPAPQPARYEMRHGLGASVCRHFNAGLEQETTIAVHPTERVKLVRVRVANPGAAARRLAVFAMQRLVLGSHTNDSARRVVTTCDGAAGVLFATNPAAADFAGPVTFAAAVAHGAKHTSFTTDRERFTGMRGSPAVPRAVAAGGRLDGVVGAGLEPCFAQQVEFEIAAGAAIEVTFLLGEADDAGAALACVERLRQPDAVAHTFAAARARWNDLVDALQVTTPAPELDLMVNAWLPYQTLSCRIWGRTAFYQSGGAFGFRDQLQDAVSLLALDPGRARSQILLHAAHQFVEGDVMHWWHPPHSRGMRTRFADDLLWLPYLLVTYLDATGDASVLDERAGFVRAPALEPGEDEVFLLPSCSGESSDLYDHCVRSIERSLATGTHGLPLFGTGDWNDGMNRVGREGRGESVWMAFFLFSILGPFADVAERRGDTARAARWRRHREALRTAVEREAWDGEWYRRGYYDNGAPLGSASSDECRIDALAQAWAVISGLGDTERVRQAMESVERHLVSDAEGLVRLLSPPFQDTPQDPGYIKGYVAGVRENGGQYTHAAMWVIRAMAELGWRHRAANLLERLGPIHHSRTPSDVARYQVEPYVVAADIYGAAPHVGRGGWTWYTGSSGWMYRVYLESILGVRLEGGDTLVVRPCVPDSWPGYRVRWRVPGRAEVVVEVQVRNERGCTARVLSAELDGRAVPVVEGAVRCPLPGTAGTHVLAVELGP